MSVSNFDVLKKMSLENKNITLCPDVLNMSYSKKSDGTRIEVGVPGNPIASIFNGKKKAVLLMWDVAEFDEAKSRLEELDGK
jgi:hypothetical protein